MECIVYLSSACCISAPIPSIYFTWYVTYWPTLNRSEPCALTLRIVRIQNTQSPHSNMNKIIQIRNQCGRLNEGNLEFVEMYWIVRFAWAGIGKRVIILAGCSECLHLKCRESCEGLRVPTINSTRFYSWVWASRRLALMNKAKAALQGRHQLQIGKWRSKFWQGWYYKQYFQDAWCHKNELGFGCWQKEFATNTKIHHELITGFRHSFCMYDITWSSITNLWQVLATIGFTCMYDITRTNLGVSAN